MCTSESVHILRVKPQLKGLSLAFALTKAKTVTIDQHQHTSYRRWREGVENRGLEEKRIMKERKRTEDGEGMVRGREEREEEGCISTSPATVGYRPFSLYTLCPFLGLFLSSQLTVPCVKYTTKAILVEPFNHTLFLPASLASPLEHLTGQMGIH